MAGAKRGWLRAPLALGLVPLLAHCSQPRSAQTQVVVAVAADAQLAPKLKALKVLLYPANASGESAPARVQQLPAPDRGDAELSLPLSFGVYHQDADVLLLSVLGCGDGRLCRDVRVAYKTLLHFRAGRTVQVDVVLSSACEGLGTCGELRSSCEPWSPDAGAPGTCVPVQEAKVTPIKPGDEVFPNAAAPPWEEEPADARADAGAPWGGESDVDAADLTDAAPSWDSAAPVEAAPSFDATTPLDGAPDLDTASAEAGDAALPLRMCGPNACLPEYPCLPTQGDGSVCRGQFADWQMPDTLPDASVPAHYEVVSPEVARDTVTGLYWQRQLPNMYEGCSGAKTGPHDRCTWEEAKAYCRGLTLAGRRFRLPTKIELESLIELRPRHDLDPVHFFTTPYDSHWTVSSNPIPGRSDMAYVVTFPAGQSSVLKKLEPAAVRCVHSSDDPPLDVPSRFDRRLNEQIIADRRTQLQWSIHQLCTASFSFLEAADVCAGLPGGMRLPSLKELLTLVDPTRYPSIVDAFPSDADVHRWYWSSTSGMGGHWLLDFTAGISLVEAQYPGFTTALMEPSEKCVRCVR